MITNFGLLLTVCPLLLILIRKYREHYVWRFFKEHKDLQGRVFIVTGATSGIGKEAAKELLKRNATVIMACRNPQKTEDTVQEIRKSISSGEIIPMDLDLASLTSVRKFAEEVLVKFDKIEGLINNAGLAIPNFKTTEDGLEMHMGVNHFGHFLLTDLLLRKLKDSAPSRIVVVSSGLHERGFIDFNALEDVSEKTYPKKSEMAAYSNSKLANVYFARELAERLENTGVNVYYVCPGFCFTDVFRYSNIKWYWYILGIPIIYFYLRSSNQGAQTLIYCALSDKLKNETGKYYRNCQEWQSKHKFKDDVQKKLWEVSGKIVERK